MSPAAPSVSVVVPVHNGERYLAECVRSILDQEHPALDVHVVDNASTDGTADVARSFPSVRYHRLEEKGLAKALNYGIDHSTGDVLAFLDSDDLWTPNRLVLQLDALARDPDLDVVYGHIEQFVSPELDEATKAKLAVRDERMPGRHKSAMVIRRESFRRVGPFEPTIDMGDFIDWYMRARDLGLREVVLPEVVARRRIHTSNMGHTDRAKRVEYARILKRSLDRRRRLAGR